jgi:hypothetical protein
VHKVLTPRGEGLVHWATSEDPGHWNYWRREVEVYESGLPARLGIGAPELIEVRERDDGRVELVLEHLDGRHGAALTLEDLVGAAQVLGRAQGGSELPEAPWLSRGFLRTYATTRAVDYALLDDDDAWALPLLKEHFPAELRRGLQRLHANREALFRIAESAQRTVAHLDVWPNNIIISPDGEPVLIDWQFTGDGAIGEDVANLVPDSVFDLLLDHTRIEELAERAIEAYINGLRDAGWKGAADDVRTAIAACAVKYDWMFHYILKDARNPEQVRAYGDTVADPQTFFAARAAALRLCVGWADEALRRSA